MFETTMKLSRNRQQKLNWQISDLVLKIKEEEEIEKEIPDSIVIEYNASN